MAGRRDASQFEALFERAPFGLAILDSELRFERVNAAFARLDAVAADAHAGRGIEEILPSFGPELTEAIHQTLETRGAVQDVAVVGETAAAPGQDRVWIVSAFLLDGADGVPAPQARVVLELLEGTDRRDVANRLDILTSRSQLLTEFYVAAVRRHTDEQEILDLLARRAAEIVGDACFVSLVRAGRLVPVATYARDLEQRRFAEQLLPFSDALDDIVSDLPPVSHRSFLLREIADADYPSVVATSIPSMRPFIERFRVHGILGAPLRVEGRVVGSIYLGQTDPARERYSADDVGFVEGLALRASLVLENARAIVEREALRRRAEVVAEFLESVAERGRDEATVLQLLATQSARAVGDAALVIMQVADEWLELAAIDSTDADLEAAARQHLQGRRIAFVKGSDLTASPLDPSTGHDPDADVIPDRDDDGEPDFDDLPGLDALSGPEGVAIRGMLESIDATSVIAQPLHVGGAIAGALVLLRGEGMRPFDPDEVDLIRNLAGRASLALDNVRTHVTLADTASRLTTILEESPVPTVEIDPSLRVLLWNRAAEQMFGWSEHEVLGETLPIVPNDLVGEFVEMIRSVLAGDTVRGRETVRQRRDGSRFEVAVYDAAVPGREGSPSSVILRMVDIHQRKKLEAELQATSQTLRAILDASPLAIMAVGLDRRVTYWSKGSEKLYGWTADEALERTPPFLVPGEPDALEPYLSRVRAGESVTIEDLRRRSKDGQEVIVRAFTAPIQDQSGAVVGMLGIHEDIREQRRLEAELFEARKMESVGRLAGGIAHDFNNILTAIIGFADLGLTDPTAADVRSTLSTIRSSAERAAGLTQQLLAFSRRQMLQPQLLDPNEVVLHMETILRRLIGEEIDLGISVTPRVGSIRADRTQLEQVILNLALNARDAMPEGGRLVIRTEHVRFDETSLSRHFEITPGDYVQISVSDTGIGMDEATKAQIFEPFFTTKRAGAGTGLGLATTYGIVKQSGGYIWVYSEPGRGTTFKLHFPAIPEEVVAERPLAAAAGPRTGRVLLVEDEPVLRELGRQVLTRHGYDVTIAQDGAEALHLVELGADRFDLLLTDVVMPRMNGTQLAARLRERQPGLRVVLMSGYAEEIATAGASGGEGDTATLFLGKPFTPDTLLRTVDAALSDRGRSERRAGKRR